MHRWLRHRLPTSLAEPPTALCYAAPHAGLYPIRALPRAGFRYLAL